MRRSKQLTVHGIKYGSIAEFAKEHGIDESSVNARAKNKGISKTEAAEQIEDEIKNGTYRLNGGVFEGKPYVNKHELCKSLGTNYTTILRMMKKSKSLTFEEALSLWKARHERHEDHPHNRTSIIVNGKRYESMKAWCDANDIPWDMVADAAQSQGVSFEQVAEWIENEEKTPLTVNGVCYENAAECSRETGIKMSEMRTRRTCGNRSVIKKMTTQKAFQSIIDDRANGRNLKRALPPSFRSEVLAKTGGTCYLCGASITAESMHMDHRVPRNAGGSDDIENIWPTCRSCNQSKSYLTVDEFLRHCEEVVTYQDGMTK